jgi:hypothetical protein
MWVHKKMNFKLPKKQTTKSISVKISDIIMGRYGAIGYTEAVLNICQTAAR